MKLLLSSHVPTGGISSLPFDTPTPPLWWTSSSRLCCKKFLYNENFVIFIVILCLCFYLPPPPPPHCGSRSRRLAGRRADKGGGYALLNLVSNPLYLFSPPDLLKIASLPSKSAFGKIHDKRQVNFFQFNVTVFRFDITVGDQWWQRASS